MKDRRVYGAMSHAIRTLRGRRRGEKPMADRIKVTPSQQSRTGRFDEQALQARRANAEQLVRDEEVRRRTRRFNARTI